MTEIPLRSATALILGLTGGRILNPESEKPILIFPEQQGLEEYLRIGAALDWTVDGVLRFSTVVTALQRWRQGESFVRIQTESAAT